MALMGSTGREYEIWMVLHYGKLLCGSCYMAVWLAQWPLSAWRDGSKCRKFKPGRVGGGAPM